MKVKDEKIIDTYMVHFAQSQKYRSALEATYLDLELDKDYVVSVLNKAKIREYANDAIQEFKEEVFKNKIPLIKDIIGLSLTNIKEFLVELSQNDEKKGELKVRDIRELAEVAKSLNELMRLEQGESTINIGMNVTHQHNHTVTMEALGKLAAIDPVFEYPALPQPEVVDVIAE